MIQILVSFMTKVTIILITLICLLTLGLSNTFIQPVEAAGEITIPTWEEGDSWSMGFYEEFDEDKLMSGEDIDESTIGMFAQFGKFDIDGGIGFFQTLTVLDTDDTSTGIECYKVAFEQYYGAVLTADVEVHMDENDIPELSGVEGFEFQMDLDLDGYLWFQMDTDGYIYFTVDDLAIAREDINVLANADIDFYGIMNYQMSGSPEEGGSGEVTYDTGNEYSYDESIDSSGSGLFPDEMELDMELTVEDMALEYVVEYEPPLDVFDFPISPDEQWSASSDMTITLNKIAGAITYDFAGKIPDSDFQPQSGSVELGKGLTLPDTFGPESVYYDFYNVGTGQTGNYKDCIIIMSGDAYEDYYYYDYYTRGVDTAVDTSVEEPMVTYESEEPWDMLEGFENFDAEALTEFNPVNAFMISNAYYSPSAGMIVSSDISQSSESMPFDFSDGGFGLLGDTGDIADTSMKPVTKAEVDNFKNVQREDMEEQYQDYKEASEGSDSGLGSVFLWLIVIVVVVIVLIVAAMMVSRKKKGQEMPPYPPQHVPPPATAQQPAPVYDTSPDREVPPPPQPGYNPPPPPPAPPSNF